MIITLMLELLYCCLGAFLSFVAFDILFYAINRSILSLFLPSQNYLSKMKKKNFLKNLLFLISIVLSVKLKNIFDLTPFGYGFVLGGFYSFTNMLFKDGLIG